MADKRSLPRVNRRQVLKGIAAAAGCALTPCDLAFASQEWQLTHPDANWFDPDVLGIDQGISVLMAENLRSGTVWNTFIRNRESLMAMERAGFRGKGLAG